MRQNNTQIAALSHKNLILLRLEIFTLMAITLWIFSISGN